MGFVIVQEAGCVLSFLHVITNWLEGALGESLTPIVRRNMYMELCSSLAFGIFTVAGLQFVPVLLRRWGASPGELAIYIAQSYIGLVITPFSILLMRGWRPQKFAALCWFVGRATLLGFALVHNVFWALVITGIYWTIESFPSPAYSHIFQTIYPERIRGQVASIVRLGMAGAMLVTAPLAGWALDHWGSTVQIPLAALFGWLAVWFFYRLKVAEGSLPANKTQSLSTLWEIVRKDRRYAVHLLAVAVYGLGALAGSPLYPIVQVDRLNLSYSWLGTLSLVQSLLWLIGLALWGRLIDRRGASWVFRLNLLVAICVPTTYIFATNGWMLLPAFMAQGIISAGIDLSFLNTCIQLADREKVLEYSAIQSTVIGLRGMAGSFVGAGLQQIGFTQTMVFATGVVLIFLSWLIHRRIRV